MTTDYALSSKFSPLLNRTYIGTYNQETFSLYSENVSKFGFASLLIQKMKCLIIINTFIKFEL